MGLMRLRAVSLLCLTGMPLVASSLFTSSGYVQSGSLSDSFSSSVTSLGGTSGALGFPNGEILSLTGDNGFPTSGTVYQGAPAVIVSESSDDIDVDPWTVGVTGLATETLKTAGPVRQGIITYQLLSSGGASESELFPYVTSAYGFSKVGISDGIHTYGQQGCQGTCQTGLIEAPFELGTVFTALSFANETGVVSAPSFASAGGNITFNFFEADGVTPVALLDTPEGTPAIPINLAPEPRTNALSSCALLLIAGLFANQRQNQKSDPQA